MSNINIGGSDEYLDTKKKPNSRPTLTKEYENLIREEVSRVAREEKSQLFILFTLLASFLTFMVGQFKFLENTQNVKHLLSLSCFILGALVLFSTLVKTFLDKNTDKNQFLFFYGTAVALIILSILLFLFTT
jgi:cation transport ATPase